MHFRINGTLKSVSPPANTRLLDFLRHDLHLKSVKEGCGSGDCGACSVVLNNKLVPSCLVLLAHLKPREINDILTVDYHDHLMSDIKASFISCGGTQCGICTPGIVVSSYALLKENPSATTDEIKYGLGGNLCRCTGYTKIIDAVKNSQKMAVQR